MPFKRVFHHKAEWFDAWIDRFVDEVESTSVETRRPVREWPGMRISSGAKWPAVTPRRATWLGSPTGAPAPQRES